MPIWRLPSNASAARPTSVGPLVQPKSPARAKSANIAVPPLGSSEDAMLNEPGQRIPTDRPHIPQPASATIELVDKVIIR